MNWVLAGLCLVAAGFAVLTVAITRGTIRDQRKEIERLYRRLRDGS